MLSKEGKKLFISLIGVVLMFSVWLYLSPRYVFVRFWGGDATQAFVIYNTLANFGEMIRGKRFNPTVIASVAIGIGFTFEVLQLVGNPVVFFLTGTFDPIDLLMYLIRGLAGLICDAWIQKE